MLLQTLPDSSTIIVREPSLSGNMVIGVVSGLVTGALIYLVAVLWRQVIVPWYEQRVYKGLNVSGVWKHSAEDPGKGDDLVWMQYEQMEIRQTANRISGTVSLQPTEEAIARGDEPRTYILEGTITDGFVNASLRPTDRQRIGHLAMLLQVVGDGGQMEGQTAYYDVKRKVITAVPAAYVRAKG